MANVLPVEKQILIRQLLKLGWSYRKIERRTGIRRETVSKYDPDHPRAKAAKVPSEEEAGDEQNRPKRPPAPRKPTRRSKCVPHESFIRAELEKGQSAQRIYQDLTEKEGFTGSYDSVKRFVRSLKDENPKVYARMHARPGEQMQVDFGQAVPSKRDGQYRTPWLFKAVLSYSRHSYEEVVWGQDIETFIRCHERAFAAFGGVPETVVHDNLKSAVLRAHLYEPKLNPTYVAFGVHAGFAPDPCEPGRPEHKGKVESGVKYTKNNALKGLRFESLEAQNAHLRNWNRTWARTRIHGTTKKQVWKVFRETERAALGPLPERSFAYFDVGRRRVHPDGHIEVKRAYYSVPHQLVGQWVSVHFNSDWVKVFVDGELIAFHRTAEPGRFSTRNRHRGPRDPGDTETYVKKLLGKAEAIGPDCEQLAQKILAQRGRLGIRALQGILRLGESYETEILEAACARTLRSGALRYGIVQAFCREEARPEERALTSEHPVLRPLSDYQDHIHQLSQRRPNGTDPVST